MENGNIKRRGDNSAVWKNKNYDFISETKQKRNIYIYKFFKLKGKMRKKIFLCDIMMMVFDWFIDYILSWIFCGKRKGEENKMDWNFFGKLGVESFGGSQRWEQDCIELSLRGVKIEPFFLCMYIGRWEGFAIVGFTNGLSFILVYFIHSSSEPKTVRKVEMQEIEMRVWEKGR